MERRRLLLTRLCSSCLEKACTKTAAWARQSAGRCVNKVSGCVSVATKQKPLVSLCTSRVVLSLPSLNSCLLRSSFSRRRYLNSFLSYLLTIVLSYRNPYRKAENYLQSWLVIFMSNNLRLNMCVLKYIRRRYKKTGMVYLCVCWTPSSVWSNAAGGWKLELLYGFIIYNFLFCVLFLVVLT